MGIGGIKVVHAVPGRIRVKVSKVKENPTLAGEIERQLSTIQGIRRVEANPVTGSVLVLYDPGAMTSLNPLLALSETFPLLFPEFDVRELEVWLASSGNGSNSERSVAESISSFFRTLNAEVGKATGGLDLKILLPLTLFFFGLRGLLLSEKVPFPSWYDLLWFSFATFVMLNRPAVEAGQ